MQSDRKVVVRGIGPLGIEEHSRGFFQDIDCRSGFRIGYGNREALGMSHPAHIAVIMHNGNRTRLQCGHRHGIVRSIGKGDDSLFAAHTPTMVGITLAVDFLALSHLENERFPVKGRECAEGFKVGIFGIVRFVRDGRIIGFFGVGGIRTVCLLIGSIPLFASILIRSLGVRLHGSNIDDKTARFHRIGGDHVGIPVSDGSNGTVRIGYSHFPDDETIVCNGIEAQIPIDGRFECRRPIQGQPILGSDGDACMLESERHGL